MKIFYPEHWITKNKVLDLRYMDPRQAVRNGPVKHLLSQQDERFEGEPPSHGCTKLGITRKD